MEHGFRCCSVHCLDVLSIETGTTTRYNVHVASVGIGDFALEWQQMCLHVLDNIIAFISLAAPHFLWFPHLQIAHTDAQPPRIGAQLVSASNELELKLIAAQNRKWVPLGAKLC